MRNYPDDSSNSTPIFGNTHVSMVSNAKGTETTHLRVSDILHSIKTGEWQEPVGRIRAEYARAAREERDPKEAVDKLKKALPGVLWSGQFSTRKGTVPLSEKLVRYSGILCADLDHLGDRLEYIWSILATSPHVWAIFRSPTGTGLKVLFRIPPNAESHRDSFSAVQKYVRDFAGCEIDEACSDVTRLCFVSYDPELWLAASEPELLVACTEVYGRTGGHSVTSVASVASVSSVSSGSSVHWGCTIQLKTVADAVRHAVPIRTHQNNHQLFILARALKGVEIQQGNKLSHQHLRDAFEQWYGEAKEMLRPEQSKEDYVIEFLNAYGRAKYPLGGAAIPRAWEKALREPLPAEAMQFEGTELRLLVALCRQLQILAGNDPYDCPRLSMESICDAMLAAGVKPMTLPI